MYLTEGSDVGEQVIAKHTVVTSSTVEESGNWPSPGIL